MSIFANEIKLPSQGKNRKAEMREFADEMRNDKK